MSASLRPAYLLIGDAFLAGEKFKQIQTQIDKTYSGDIACQTVHLTDAPFENVLQQARTLPFLVSAQMFRIQDLHKMNKESVEMLSAYLEAPTERSFLVFQDLEIKKNDALVKLLQKRGDVYFLEEEKSPNEAVRYIREKLKSFGKTITPGALTRLQQDYGEVPSFLDSVLDRLIAYAGKASTIDETMVDIFQEQFKAVNVFQLTDAIASRQTGAALALLKQLLEEGDGQTVALIGLLHWQIRRLWLAKVLLEEGEPESTIMRKCKMSPRQVPFLMRQLKPFSRERLERALEGLFQIDWKIKSGRTDGEVALESWLVEATA